MRILLLTAGQQQIFQQVSPATVIPGAVHRPQVQQISNNVVTLSNVQSPAVYSTQPSQLQPNRSTSQPLQTFSMSAKDTNSRGNALKVSYFAFPDFILFFSATCTCFVVVVPHIKHSQSFR